MSTLEQAGETWEGVKKHKGVKGGMGSIYKR